jgi:hypothetical protein
MSKPCLNCGTQTWGEFCDDLCEIEWLDKWKDYCQCAECVKLRKETDYSGHLSDCAVHNDPAYPNGKCDCNKFV